MSFNKKKNKVKISKIDILLEKYTKDFNKNKEILDKRKKRYLEGR